MQLYWIALGAIFLFLAAFFSYGRFLGRIFGLNKNIPTPACTVNDGIDFVPTRKTFLLGQHFSAIAAAGPIVGPILAAVWFGWLPVMIWIVAGAVLIGAVHDFSSLVGSVKNKGVSIVELVKQQLGPKGYLLFLIFVWISLMYVIVAFTDLTSGSFVEPELGGGVATSSIFYLAIGVAMGFAFYKLRIPLSILTLICLPLVGLAIWYGSAMPLRIPGIGMLSPQQTWNLLLLSYCFLASIIPVWMLLQPRGYLGGFFLYVTLAAGVVGLFLGGEKIEYPAFIGWTNPRGFPLFPFLFVTVACGACSGFHGLVCSGTTSKQIAKETDCPVVGYGGMLLEALVALIALSTVMILSQGDPLVSSSPDRIYAEGLSRFVQNFGIPTAFARSFTLLAFTTFIYDTLDVATRLARYIFQELTGWKGNWGRIGATLASLAIPLFCVSLKVTDPQGHSIPAWQVFWTIFGTSNQLLAGLSLMTLSLWLLRQGKPFWVSAIPMIFMLTMTLWALVLMVKPSFTQMLAGSFVFDPVTFVALLLFILAALLILQALKVCRLELRH
jgi:carbon starvation protein